MAATIHPFRSHTPKHRRPRPPALAPLFPGSDPMAAPGTSPFTAPSPSPAALAAARDFMAIGYTPDDMDQWTTLPDRAEIKAAMEYDRTDPVAAELRILAAQFGLCPADANEADLVSAIGRAAGLETPSS